MSSVQTSPEEFKHATITGQFCICAFVFEETRAGEYRDYCFVTVYEELLFEIVCRVNQNGKPAFSVPSGLKNVFEKLRGQKA